jgi:two-component system, OmpR family, sensor histidine kinase SenX3
MNMRRRGGLPGDRSFESDAPDLDRRRLAEALDAVGDAIVVVDVHGEVVLRNRAAERFQDARHADALAGGALRELLDRARAGEECSRELQLYGPPPEVFWMTARPLTADARRIGAVGIVRDVTEARRIENVRRDFVANVSHELKTPVGALALLAETLSAIDDPEVARGLADRIATEATRVGAIVDDLLDLGQIESHIATRESVAVSELVNAAVERVDAAAAASGHGLDVSVCPGTLVCDRRQMVSAIANLLDNAIKYSEPGGPVTLTARAADGWLTVEVRDRGVGIPSRDLDRIFERFYRVDRARSRSTGGTGLGLAIVRNVAHAHDGDVTVESREGEGSVFRLRVPMLASVAPLFLEDS